MERLVDQQTFEVDGQKTKLNGIQEDPRLDDISQGSDVDWKLYFQQLVSKIDESITTQEISKENNIENIIKKIDQKITQQQEDKAKCKEIQEHHHELEVSLAGQIFENYQIRQHIYNNDLSPNEPNVIQYKQLYLDPAVNFQFQKLKKELEDTQKELYNAKEDLQAVTFTAESRLGKVMQGKLRTVLQENEELGKELSQEWKHQLESQLQMTKEYAENLRRSYISLQEVCNTLDQENEVLHYQVMTINHQPQRRPISPRPYKQGGFEKRPNFRQYNNYEGNKPYHKHYNNYYKQPQQYHQQQQPPVGFQQSQANNQEYPQQINYSENDHRKKPYLGDAQRNKFKRPRPYEDYNINRDQAQDNIIDKYTHNKKQVKRHIDE